MVLNNCPHDVKRQFHNTKDGTYATLGVYAWCDSDLYFYHWYVGRCGTNNDNTMVNFCPLFSDKLCEKYSLRLPDAYWIGSKDATRHDGYFIVDGIYPA